MAPEKHSKSVNESCFCESIFKVHAKNEETHTIQRRNITVVEDETRLVHHHI